MKDPIFEVNCDEAKEDSDETWFFHLTEPGFEGKSYSLQQTLLDNPNEYVYSLIRAFIEQNLAKNKPQRFCFIAGRTCFTNLDKNYIVVGEILK